MIDRFARHPTAANLLMLLILVAGLITVPSLRRETFPDFAPSEVEVRVVYPGATAADVEEAVAERVEDALDGVRFVKEVRSESLEGLALVVVEMEEGADFSVFKDDVDVAVRGIRDFPVDVEDPVITQLGTTTRVLVVQASGDMPARDLKAYADQFKERLQEEPGVSLVTVDGFSDHQLRVELDLDALMRFGLSADQVADAIARQSVNLPAGAIETGSQDVVLRFVEGRRTARELLDLVVLASRGGAEVRLSDVGTVRDLFELEEERVLSRGKRAAQLRVEMTKNQDIIRVADAVRGLVEEERARHPQVLLEITQDGSTVVVDRLRMLLKNGWQGLVLVFLTMWLFFSLRLSAWVVASVPVSFLGAVFFMPMLGLTVNMMTMVGMLLALGLLMDDGIVIAENIATHRARGKPAMQAAVDGIREVSAGVFSSFLTTVCVLGPLVTIKGDIGKVLKVIPVILVLVMAVSLIEAFCILPAHLGHALAHVDPSRPGRFRAHFDGLIDGLRDRLGRAVDAALRWRYLFLGAVAGVFLASVALLAGGVVKFQAFPDLDGDVVVSRVLLPQGTPLARTQQVVAQVTGALDRVEGRFAAKQPRGQSLVQTVSVRFNLNTDAFERGPHVATITVDLLGSEQRVGRLDDILAAWREEVGEVPDILALTFAEPVFGPQGRAIDVRVQSKDLSRAKAAAAELHAWLGAFEGVSNLADDLRPGKPEVRLRLREGVYGLGLTGEAVARQVRAAFHGVTADEVQRGGESYEVDVRLAAGAQDSLADLDHMQLRLPDGSRAPLSALAEWEAGRGWARIARVNGRRTVTLRGDVDARVANTASLLGRLRREVLPELRQRFPDVRVSLEGEVKEGAVTRLSMILAGVVGVIGVFLLLSFQFRSYLEPLVVLVAIPLALVGVVWGLLLLDMDLSMPGLLGFVSLAGVVVNDSILLVLFLKQARDDGADLADAAGQASRKRFRAILLTSLTTVAGLLPLLFERSLQAQVLIPLAVSIVFGMLASTVLVLFVVPCLYVVLGDLGLLQEPSTRGGEGLVPSLPGCSDSSPGLQQEPQEAAAVSTNAGRAVVVGGGPVGCVLAALLAKHGHQVEVYEKRPDMRRGEGPAGRSINLVLTRRGLIALDLLGLKEKVLELTVPVLGRMMHSARGELTYTPYGKDESECNYSVSRAELNQFLLDEAEAAGVALHFDMVCVGGDLDAGELVFQHAPSGEERRVAAPRVFGCDGAPSAIRHLLVEREGYTHSMDLLPQGYKELTFPAASGGGYAMEKTALHIWPRGEHFLMGLPNRDGSFTGTVYLDMEGEGSSFAALSTPEAVGAFCRKEYPDAVALLDDVERTWLENPTGVLGTVRCNRWHLDDRALLVGDAAHAVVPFFGQGLNCGFEDCAVLDRILGEHDDVAAAFAEYTAARKENADAIADMALENFVEMREKVGDPQFILQKRVESRLDRELSHKYRSRYAMVMYSSIPYRVAFDLGEAQKEIVAELAQGLSDPAELDMDRAEALIDERFGPLVARAGVDLSF